MKMKNPEMEIVLFDATDVIATSGGLHSIMPGVSAMSYHAKYMGDGDYKLAGKEGVNSFDEWYSLAYDADGTLASNVYEQFGNDFWVHASERASEDYDLKLAYVQYCNDPTHHAGQ